MPGDYRSIVITSLLLVCAHAGLMGTASRQTAQNISSYSSTADKDCRKLRGGSAADTIARDFKCGIDKVKVVGMSGRAVQLALPR